MRVFQILLGDGDNKILVKLQPSVAGHPTFTDYLSSPKEIEKTTHFFHRSEKIFRQC